MSLNFGNIHFSQQPEKSSFIRFASKEPGAIKQEID